MSSSALHRTTNSRWRTVDLYGRRKWSNIPSEPGVYVFIRDGRAIYVGQSVNLRSRLSHYRGRQVYPGDRLDVQPVWRDHPIGDNSILKISTSRRYGDWLMRELRLIRRLRPHFNLAGF